MQADPVAALCAELSPFGEVARATHAAGYTPSSRRFLGVSVPDLRAVLKPWRARLGSLPAGQAIAALDAMQAAPVFEVQVAAWDLLAAMPKLRRQIPAETLARWAEGNDNWASVDGFSCGVLGPAWREGQLSDALVIGWTASPNRWLRRAALVSSVALNLPSRGGKGDVGRTLAVCRPLLSDRDPMVVKAMSWALRTLIAHDREAVARFVAENDVAPLVRREVEAKLRTGKKNPRQ